MKEVRFREFRKPKNSKVSRTSKLHLKEHLNKFLIPKAKQFAWQNKDLGGTSLNNINTSQLIDNATGAVPITETNERKIRKNKIFNRSQFIDKIKLMHNPLPTLGQPGSNMNNHTFDFKRNNVEMINMDPLANAEELITLNPMNRNQLDNYNRIRVYFLLNVFVCIAFILFELVAILLGIVYMNRCEMVDVFLIVSGANHILITFLEWGKAWIWGGYSDPAVPDSNSDHMQVFLTCLLASIYLFGLIWYAIGFAWIPAVLINFLKYNRHEYQYIYIIHENRSYRQVVPVCDMELYTFALSYQIVVGLVFMIRLTSCCMSQFCRGMCNKLIQGSANNEAKNKAFDTPTIGIANSNNLDVYLPPLRQSLYRWGISKDAGIQGIAMYSTGMQALYDTSNARCTIIAPIPVYGGEDMGQQLTTTDVINNELHLGE